MGVGLSSLKGVCRITRKNKVDNHAMREKLEIFCSDSSNGFLSFACEELSCNKDMTDLLEEYAKEIFKAVAQQKKHNNVANKVGDEMEEEKRWEELDEAVEQQVTAAFEFDLNTRPRLKRSTLQGGGYSGRRHLLRFKLYA